MVKNKQIDWMRFRPLYFILSLTLILVGIWNLTTYGLNLGVEFRGGMELEYKLQNYENVENAKDEISKLGLPVYSMQTTVDNTFIVKTGQLTNEQNLQLEAKIKETLGEGSEKLRTEMVGPSLSRDLITKTFYGVVISIVAISIWVSFQFKKISFGIFAAVATIHDALIVVGLYSLLGRFFGATADFLFVTAVLTTLSFSVHDTIVVYDRIREIVKKHGGRIYDVSNLALSQTMRRSVFNSLTIIFMLTSLTLLGDGSIRWFAAALLIGVVSGTYSSPFIAVPLLVTFDNLKLKARLPRKAQKRA